MATPAQRARAADTVTQSRRGVAPMPSNSRRSWYAVVVIGPARPRVDGGPSRPSPCRDGAPDRHRVVTPSHNAPRPEERPVASDAPDHPAPRQPPCRSSRSQSTPCSLLCPCGRTRTGLAMSTPLEEETASARRLPDGGGTGALAPARPVADRQARVISALGRAPRARGPFCRVPQRLDPKRSACLSCIRSSGSTDETNTDAGDPPRSRRYRLRRPGTPGR